jgi:hypothetical protein
LEISGQMLILQLLLDSHLLLKLKRDAGLGLCDLKFLAIPFVEVTLCPKGIAAKISLYLKLGLRATREIELRSKPRRVL